MKANKIILGIAAYLLMTFAVSAQENPVELGKVKWLRNYDAAVAQAKESDKPIFLLFQEVPGCSNCTQYGSQILSHPLIVEAIESNFVPLAIHNNKGGHDKEVLKKFGEPSWNNPVVRLIDNTGGDLVPRIANFRSTQLLITSMIKTLKIADKEIPGYLDVLKKEFAAVEGDVQEAYLSMYCFWTGEKEIAQLDGVIATEAGYMHGKEVVKVTYDKNVNNLTKISNKAKRKGCSDQVYANTSDKVVDKKTGRYRKDGQDKYYLTHSPLQYVAMTELQKTLVNSALGRGENANQYLSPRQLELAASATSKKSMISEDIYASWD